MAVPATNNSNCPADMVDDLDTPREGSIGKYDVSIDNLSAKYKVASSLGWKSVVVVVLSQVVVDERCSSTTNVPKIKLLRCGCCDPVTICY